MTIWMLAIVGTLSIYFLAFYFLSKEMFTIGTKVIEDLEIIFLKSACFDQTFGFLREDLIRNTTITARDPSVKVWGSTNLSYKSGAQLYFDYCEVIENKFRDIRKNEPPYFKEIKSFIDDLESPAICKKVFVDDL